MLKHSQTPAPSTARTSWARPSPAGTPESGEAERLVQGRPQNVMEQGSGFASGLEGKAAQMGPAEDRGSEVYKGKWEQLQAIHSPLCQKDPIPWRTDSSKQHVLFDFAFIPGYKTDMGENFSKSKD